MKRIVLLGCFFLYTTAVLAQGVTGTVTGTTFNYQMISSTQHNFTFHTYFNLGYQSTCPSLINPTFSIVDTTLYVKGYYSILGAWPSAFCESFDTVTYNYEIPPTITHIITSTNVIGYNNTPPYIPSTMTYENVYTHDFDLTALSTNSSSVQSISIYPNPSSSIINLDYKELLVSKIQVVNSLGQFVKTQLNNFEVIDIAEIPLGVYILKIDTDRGTLEKKIIKN